MACRLHQRTPGNIPNQICSTIRTALCSLPGRGQTAIGQCSCLAGEKGRTMRMRSMSFGARIDELIEAGWGVLESDFDPVAFQHWRRRALDCLTAVVGPDHASTRRFQHLVEHGGETQLRVARGTSAASREQGRPDRLSAETSDGKGNVRTSD
jgi:hypothetical protein